LIKSETDDNPFDNPTLVTHYEEWYTGRGRRADRLEKRLLENLLREFPAAETVLEIGCGTGHFTRWMSRQGLEAVGLDLSEAMLEEARHRNGLPYISGNAEELPFANRAFDLSVLITTLEFVSNPQRALSEAVRIAEQGVLLGVLNRRSLLGIRRLNSGKPPWNSAKFYTPHELTSMLAEAAGERLVSIRWQTTLWPFPVRGSLPLPWGGFIGLAAKLRQTDSLQQG
jgi:ubiquinone/menaquinone biosynthesis C-methylase UbiE